LNRENNDSLWLWILGMTDLIVHQRSGSYSFDQDVMECSNEVLRLNPNINNNNRSDDFEDNPDSAPTENPQTGAADKDLFKYVSLKSRNRELGSIMLE